MASFILSPHANENHVLPMNIFLDDIKRVEGQYRRCKLERVDHWKEKGGATHEFIILSVYEDGPQDTSSQILLRMERRLRGWRSSLAPAGRLSKTARVTDDTITRVWSLPDLSSHYYLNTVNCASSPSITPAIVNICETLYMEETPHLISSMHCYWFCSTFLLRLAEITPLEEKISKDYDRGGRFYGIRIVERDPLPQALDLSNNDIIIVVMGLSGAGKTTFINEATGNINCVHGDLEGCTNEISLVRCRTALETGRNVVFVDTPGFDHSEIDDLSILKKIADLLRSTGKRGITFAGALYLHDVSRPMSSPNTLRLFEALCGRKVLPNVKLVTTMWGILPADSIAEEHEEELKREHWRWMIEQGAKTARYGPTQDWAWSIVEDLLQDSRQRFPTRLEVEVVKEKKRLDQTEAFQVWKRGNI